MSLKPLKFIILTTTATCVLTIAKKMDYISPVLASWHWLPVKSRREFKVLLRTCW